MGAISRVVYAMCGMCGIRMLTLFDAEATREKIKTQINQPLKHVDVCWRRKSRVARTIPWNFDVVKCCVCVYCVGGCVCVFKGGWWMSSSVWFSKAGLKCFFVLQLELKES